MDQNNIDQQANIYIQKSYAQAQDLQQAGIEMEKSWSAVEDGKDCQQCLENQKAGWIPINQAFPSGHQIPLGHDGCRCDLRIRRKKEMTPPSPKPSTRKIINILIIIASFICLTCCLIGFLSNSTNPKTTNLQQQSTQAQLPQPTIYLSPVTESGLTAYVFTPLPQQLTPQYIPSSKTPDDYLSIYGGDRKTYEDILSLTNCTTLQEKFNIAFENNQSQPAGSKQAKWSLGYMTASDDRMREIGCYK